MSCEQAASELTLYHYGELSQEEEERIEQHLADCSLCAAELARVRAFGRALLGAETPVSEALLNRCRVDLARSIRLETAAGPVPRRSFLEGLRAWMHMGVGFRIPAGALALVAAGFLAGKLAPGTLPFLNAFGTGSQQAGIVNVRSVEHDNSGGVRISFDNVSRGVLSGSMEDPRIREMLLSSMHDEANPGLRVEAVGIIKDHAAESDIRGALLDAMRHDPNLGVRMAALEGLSRYRDDPTVRTALTEALLNDGNAGVRVKAIDLLTQRKDAAMVGPFQDVMQKEGNRYVRSRASDALRGMNASVGTF